MFLQGVKICLIRDDSITTGLSTWNSLNREIILVVHSKEVKIVRVERPVVTILGHC